MAKKWIQEAIKRPGALTAKAKKAGGITKGGTIKKSYLAKKSSGTTQKQKNLAKTLSKLRKKK